MVRLSKDHVRLTSLTDFPACDRIPPVEGLFVVAAHRFRGGIPDGTFINLVCNATIRGRQKREDIVAAIQKWPLMNEYWEYKVIKTDSIDIPIYSVASYGSGIHGFGTIEGWRKARSQKKWLRIHCTQEWYDIYRKDTNDELQMFFDRYLKGIENDWERMDPVRVSVLNYGDRFGPVGAIRARVKRRLNVNKRHRNPSNTFPSAATLTQRLSIRLSSSRKHSFPILPPRAGHRLAQVG